jgi:REP element-mobilizing transposase RayT
MRKKRNVPEKGTRKLREGRFSGRNQIYHVSTAIRDRQPVFESLLLGRIVVQAMKREDEAGHTATIAFVVMPDHLHWLFQLVGNRSLQVSVNTAKSYSTRRVNKLVHRQGFLWQKGFYDRAIRRDEDLASIARYIVANPVRSGLVGSIRHYSLWDAIWV